MFYILDEFSGISPGYYKPLIKEQEEEIEMPAALKNKLEAKGAAKNNANNNNNDDNKKEKPDKNQGKNDNPQ